MISKKRGVTLVILVLFLIVLSFNTISEEPLEQITFSNNDIESYEELDVVGEDDETEGCNSYSSTGPWKNSWFHDKEAYNQFSGFEQSLLINSDVLKVKAIYNSGGFECSWNEHLSKEGCYIFAAELDSGKNNDDCAGVLLEPGYIFDQIEQKIIVSRGDSTEKEIGVTFPPNEGYDNDDAINYIFNCDLFRTYKGFSFICADKKYTFLNKGNQQVTENKKVWLKCNKDEVDKYIQLTRETEVFIESEVDEPELTETEKATEIVISQEVYQCQLLNDNYVWVNLGDLTCDLVNCDNYQNVCEDQGYSWQENPSSGNNCCGDDGLDDFTKEGSNSAGNYICLKNDKEVIGYSGDSEKVFDNSNCGKEWCWVNAIGDVNTGGAKYNIFTIKKPLEQAYDIVSNNNQWITCDQNYGEKPIDDYQTYTPDSSGIDDVNKMINRFYCYNEGNHWSWAECARELKDRENKGIKGRYPGEGLNTLSLLKDGIVISERYGANIDIKFSNYYEDFYGDDYLFDFSGYTHLNFMLQFCEEIDESCKAIGKDDLSQLPANVMLRIFGPKDVNNIYDEDFIPLFSKSVLGDVINGPLFSQSFMHVKVKIPENLKVVSGLRIDSNPSLNKIKIKNVYLTKTGDNPLCSGQDTSAENDNSWITDVDQNSGEVTGEFLCKNLYGDNAWLGNYNEVDDPSASCCGNTAAEYYSGESKEIGPAEGLKVKHGCWNSQPLANEQTTMNVKFEVDYSEEEVTVNYPFMLPKKSDLIISGYELDCDNDFEIGDKICNQESSLDYCIGQKNIKTCIGLKDNFKKPPYLFCSTLYSPQEGIDNYEYQFSTSCYSDCLSGKSLAEATIEKSCVKKDQLIEKDGGSIYPSQYSQNKFEISFEEGIKLVSTLTYNPDLADDDGYYGDLYTNTLIDKFTIEKSTNEELTNAYFYHSSLGMFTELSIEQFKEFGTVDIYAEPPAAITIDEPSTLTSITNQPFIYPCNASECLYPLPGIPEKGITVTNPKPDLYELYFVTNENDDYKETLISGTDTINQPANLLVKKVAQQVVFLSPFSEEELVNPDFYAEDPEIGFYGCQAAQFIEDQQDLNGNPVLTTNEPYCSVKEDFFCAPSVTLGTIDKYTAINSWSTETLTKVGYEEPVESGIDEIETYFEQLDLKLKEGETKPSNERNFTAPVLPARNFIPNAEFIVKGGKLSYWEVFDGLDVEDTENEVFEKKVIDIPAGKTLKTERIAIPKNEELQFSYSGTATATITLVDKDGKATLPASNTFPTAQNSYLTIEFTAGTVEEPFLQLVDSLGPITDYSYTPKDEIQRSGLACCPQDYCWNGYACIEPMNEEEYYTQISEHIDDDRNYRCIAGEWKNSPIKWDWNAENWGFCEDNKQCFVTKEGNLESEANFYDNDLLTETPLPPICIDNEEYVLDHYCEDGDWSSRTKFLATKLLEVAENNDDDDYILYCTNYQDALILEPNADNSKLGGGTQLTITEESSDPLSPPTEETIYTCFNTLPDTLFKTEENTCINNVCVLKFDDGAKRAFGTTLNKEITDTNSFLQTLNIVDNFETICAGTTDVIKCDLSTTSVEGDLWYMPEINAVIYSKQGIQLDSTILDTVVDWFKDLFGIDSELSGQNLFVQEAKNFKEIYLLSKGDKKAKVIKEIFPENKTLIAEFENFQTPVCDYVNPYKPEIADLEILEELSGIKKLVCTVDNETNIQSVEIAADDEALDFVWPQLTGKLRVEE